MPTQPALPVSVDTDYADSSVDPSVKVHQQHHDTLHAVANNAYRAIIGTDRTASFTVAASDTAETIRCNSSSAITVTFPTLTTGHVSKYIRSGTGTLTFATSGTTFEKASDVGLTARVQGSAVTATYLTSTLIYLEGDLT